MKHPVPSDRYRQGAIAPLAVLLFLFIMAMVAFAVDTSYMVLAQAELQNAADSASLAGAAKLPEHYVKYSLPGGDKMAMRNAAVTAAKQAAKDNALQNGAGNLRSLTLPDADINVGFTNSTGTFTSYDADNSYFPNTVKITTRRASGTNGSLRLFFGQILGTASVDLNAKATAMVYSGVVDGINPSTSGFGVLPMTYDVDFWDYFLRTGKDADGRRQKDSNDAPVLDLYSQGPFTGNFGLLSLNGTNASASTNSDWIANGPTTQDLQTLSNKGLTPLSSHPVTRFDWEGTTGYESSTVQEINANVGKTYLIPMFKAYNSSFNLNSALNGNGGLNFNAQDVYLPGDGEGSNFKYSIVRFVAVQIADPLAHGGAANRDVIVQPSALITEDVFYKAGTVVPLGSDATIPASFVFPPPKLVE